MIFVGGIIIPVEEDTEGSNDVFGAPYLGPHIGVKGAFGDECITRGVIRFTQIMHHK